MKPLSVVLFYLSMSIVALLVAYWRGHLAGWVRFSSLPLDGAIGLGAGVGIVLLSRLSLKIEAIRRLSAEFSSILAGLTRGQVALFALSSGIGEEALFRGMLQPELGFVLATLLFASLHIGPGLRFLWWTAFALLVGAFFGWLAIWRQAIVAPVVAHIVVNYLNLGYLAEQGTKNGISESRDRGY